MLSINNDIRVRSRSNAPRVALLIAIALLVLGVSFVASVAVPSSVSAHVATSTPEVVGIGNQVYVTVLADIPAGETVKAIQWGWALTDLQCADVADYENTDLAATTTAYGAIEFYATAPVVTGNYSFFYQTSVSDTCDTITAPLIENDHAIEVINEVPEVDEVLCKDTIDNDADGLIDLDDPECAAFVPAPPISGGTGNPSGGTSPNGGGGVMGPSSLSVGFVNTNPTAGSGLVLGTTTECAPHITSFLKKGKQNDAEQVKKLQAFLGAHLNINIPITGYFGEITFAAVESFQLTYWQEVLLPWVAHKLPSDHTPTGYVYKTTQRMINALMCPGTVLPVPQLP